MTSTNASIMTVPPCEAGEALTCTDCGANLAHDLHAEAWLRSTHLYAPDQCDIGDNGSICPETGDEHTVGPRCEYTALTRYGTEQCDEQVADAASGDQWDREFCGFHSEQTRRFEVEDRYTDEVYS